MKHSRYVDYTGFFSGYECRMLFIRGQLTRVGECLPALSSRLITQGGRNTPVCRSRKQHDFCEADSTAELVFYLIDRLLEESVEFFLSGFGYCV